MTFNNCNNRFDCPGIAVVSSIIIGIITAFLRFTAVITVTPAFLWALFGIAIVYLAITPVTSTIIRTACKERCVCSILSALLTGILGTILTSIILLAIEFAATSVVGAVITGALLAFFWLTVTTFACLARCAAKCPGTDV